MFIYTYLSDIEDPRFADIQFADEMYNTILGHTLRNGQVPNLLKSDKYPTVLTSVSSSVEKITKNINNRNLSEIIKCKYKLEIHTDKETVLKLVALNDFSECNCLFEDDTFRVVSGRNPLGGLTVRICEAPVDERLNHK